MVSPLQKFNLENQERWTVLRDMPEWISTQVCNWIAGLYYTDNGNLRNDVVSTIQTELRIVLEKICPLRIDEGRAVLVYDLNQSFLAQDGDALLLLDITVKYVRDYAPGQVPFGGGTVQDKRLLNLLESILDNGSKWTVVDQMNADSGIVERVADNLVKAAELVQDDHLTKAWNYAFQLMPEPEKAIEEAQKAVESVASETGLTNLTSQVFGGFIADIKANPNKYVSAASEAFALHDVLNKNSNMLNENFALWFADGLNFVQKTHPARHKSTAVKSFKLTPAAAKQAVMLATFFCWLMSQGYFRKKIAKTKKVPAPKAS